MSSSPTRRPSSSAGRARTVRWAGDRSPVGSRTITAYLLRDGRAAAGSADPGADHRREHARPAPGVHDHQPAGPELGRRPGDPALGHALVDPVRAAHDLRRVEQQGVGQGGLQIVPRPPGVGEHPRVLRADDERRVEAADELVVRDAAQARGERSDQRGRCPGDLVGDGARPLGGEHGHRGDALLDAARHRQRLPGGALPRPRRTRTRPCRGARAPPGPPRPGRPPPTLRITSCSARPIVELARLPWPSALPPAFIPIAGRHRAVDDDGGPGRVGRREQAVRVELVGARGLDGGEHDRQVVRTASGQHGVDRDLLDGDLDEVGRHGRDDVGRVARRALEHPQHPRRGRRDDRQPVRPAAGDTAPRPRPPAR